MRNPITIEGPAFDQHEDVWLHLGKSSLPTRVIARRFHLDQGQWQYQVAVAQKSWFTISSLDHRSGEAA